MTSLVAPLQQEVQFLLLPLCNGHNTFVLYSIPGATLAEGLIPLFLLLTALKLDSWTSQAQYQADVRTCYNVQHTKAKEQSISITCCETDRQNLTSIVPVCVKKKK